MNEREIPISQYMDWRENQRPPVMSKREPKLDVEVSKAVGKKVFVGNQRVTELVVKYKREKSSDSDRPDNFLRNEKFVNELKKIL